jgi:FkbM family methyltransferase
MPNNALIYDVGAHKGEDTEFYLKKGFSVVAVEAMPQLCQFLKQRFSPFVEVGQLVILNVAVAKSAGSIDFYADSKFSEWGTAQPEFVARNRLTGGGRVTKLPVQASTLKEIMDRHGTPHYCKIDIEGNDLTALESLLGSEHLPDFISLESEKRDWGRLVAEFRALQALGYKRYKVVDQETVSLQTPPHPAQEGKYCPHEFKPGCTGLFGAELPGTWLDLFEALGTYKGIFRGYALNGDAGLYSGRRSILNMLGHMQASLNLLRGSKQYLNPARILPPPGWYDTHAAR